MHSGEGPAKEVKRSCNPNEQRIEIDVSGAGFPSEPQSTSKSISNADLLLQVYQVERHDEQNTATLIVAIVTGTLAYLSAATAYLASYLAGGSTPNLPSWVLLGAPFPLLILSGYVTFHYGASRLRQSYLMYLEDCLAERQDRWPQHVTVPGFMTLHQGLFSSWGRMAPFTLLTIVTVLAHVAAVAGFTIYVVGPVAENAHIGLAILVIFRVLYGLMILLNITAMTLIILFAGGSRLNILNSLRNSAGKAAIHERERWKWSTVGTQSSLNAGGSTNSSISISTTGSHT